MIDELEPEIISRIKGRAKSLENKIEYAEIQKRVFEQRIEALTTELADCRSILRKAGA